MAPVAAPLHRILVATAVNWGFWFIVIVIDEVAAEHGPVPSGSLVVRVKIKVPAVISPALGVYIAFNVFAFGLNVPIPPLHVADVAEPPMLPARFTVGFKAHTD
jgi:hypothetical protein